MQKKPPSKSKPTDQSRDGIFPGSEGPSRPSSSAPRVGSRQRRAQQRTREGPTSRPRLCCPCPQQCMLTCGQGVCELIDVCESWRETIASISHHRKHETLGLFTSSVRACRAADASATASSRLPSQRIRICQVRSTQEHVGGHARATIAANSSCSALNCEKPLSQHTCHRARSAVVAILTN